MRFFLILLFLCWIAPHAPLLAQTDLERDVVKTKGGDLEISFIGHGTLMMKYDGKVIHVDPWSRLADYTMMPKADLILVTHHHGDHLDVGAITALRKKETVVLLTEAGAGKVQGGVVITNGQQKKVLGISVTAVPAYNLVHKRDSGEPFHPKGEGNGYVIDFSGTRVYVAGDTENTPEMRALKDIAISFLPMNIPYTMTPEMVADAVKAFRPKILYPYHYGETAVSRLLELLKDVQGVEMRIRSMK